MLTVGYWDQNYPEKRNIIYSGEHTAQVRYVPVVRKKHALMSHYAERDLPASDVIRNIQAFHYQSLRRKPYDLIHCYNGTCCVPDLPWVSTAESFLPRILGITKNNACAKIWRRYAYELLAGNRCKALFFLSKDSYEMEARQLRSDYGGAYYQDIMPKVRILHPPQAVNLTEQELEEKSAGYEKRLELMFVGSAFWWKGGKEMVEALTPFAGNYPIHLTIVSDFNLFRAEEFGYTKQECRACIREIRKNENWITVYNKLPNRQVLRMMRKAHAGLLPSYGDTYGFSVLEFQASGCPVITTDHRAFPEINPPDCGWMTRIEGTRNGIREQREDNREQLSHIIEDILTHPEQLKEKAHNCVERIREQHDPQKHAETLFTTYQKALSK